MYYFCLMSIFLFCNKTFHRFIFQEFNCNVYDSFHVYIQDKLNFNFLVRFKQNYDAKMYLVQKVKKSHFHFVFYFNELFKWIKNIILFKIYMQLIRMV